MLEKREKGAVLLEKRERKVLCCCPAHGAEEGGESERVGRALARGPGLV